MNFEPFHTTELQLHRNARSGGDSRKRQTNPFVVNFGVGITNLWLRYPYSTFSFKAADR